MNKKIFFILMFWLGMFQCEQVIIKGKQAEVSSWVEEIYEIDGERPEPFLKEKEFSIVNEEYRELIQLSMLTSACLMLMYLFFQKIGIQ